MTKNLYWILALVFALVMLIILLMERRNRPESVKSSIAFRMLLYWTTYLCSQDMFWGFCFSGVIRSDGMYFLFSELFHFAYVFTAFWWFFFVLVFLKVKQPYNNIALSVCGLLVLAEVGLCVTNCFKPVLFSIHDGEYVMGEYRMESFSFQFLIYLLTGIAAVILLCNMEIRKSELGFKCKAVCCSSVVSVFMGVFQLTTPDAPFFSLGAVLSSLTLYVFVTTWDRDMLQSSKERFLRNMSHEIRTTINSIYGFAQLLSLPQGMLADKEREEYGRHISNSYKMLDMLLNDLMVYIRSRENGYGIEVGEVEVASLCHDAVLAVDGCKPDNVDIKMECHLPDGYTIRSDGRRILQILQNLLVNACQFEGKGEIILKVTLEADKLLFTISDEGQGSLYHLEGPTYQEKKKKVMPGIGLRLKMGTEIAKMLGGRMYQDEGYKEGTRYVLELNIEKE